jgi:endonuclease YncB( thermonuclease family)
LPDPVDPDGFPPPRAPAYVYRARPGRAVDGDTVDLDVDLGFKLTAEIRVRVLGVDAPERGRPGYKEATRFVADWLDLFPEILVETTGKVPEKHGRWLGHVWGALAPGRPVEANLAVDLLRAGHARSYPDT